MLQKERTSFKFCFPALQVKIHINQSQSLSKMTWKDLNVCIRRWGGSFGGWWELNITTDSIIFFLGQGLLAKLRIEPHCCGNQRKRGKKWQLARSLSVERPCSALPGTLNSKQGKGGKSKCEHVTPFPWVLISLHTLVHSFILKMLQNRYSHV